MKIEDELKRLNISYQIIEHNPVYTIQDTKAIKQKIEGIGCKNLFLKNKNGLYYILLLPENQKADLKKLESELKISRLSFGTEQELEEILKLKRGSVTPLGIINDKKKQVKILIHHFLLEKTLLLHPNRNTATISMRCADLEYFIKKEGHTYQYV